MAGLVPLPSEGSFQNWLKGALGVLFAKEGLTYFVRTEITQFQTDLLQFIWNSNGIPAGTTCNTCTTTNLQKGQPCPNGICDALMKAIRKEHWFNKPSWKNTDARRWSIDAFELSKCYMPPDGYLGTKTFEDTDFNGTLSVIINNKRFQNRFMAKLNTPPMTLCKKAREIGRAIRHSPDLLLTDADLAQYLTDLITLLSDLKFLASDPKAQVAVRKLNQLQTNTLTIHGNDITQIIHDNIGRSMSRQHQAVLQDIQSHLCAVQTASIAAIDEITRAKLTALDKIKLEISVHTDQNKKDIDDFANQKMQDIQKFADQKKQDIYAHTHKKKHDIDVYIGQKKQYLEKYKDQKEEEYAGFQKELIEFYRREHGTTSVSPLVEEHEIPLIEFYVKPQLVAVDQRPFGNTTKTPVLNYEQLFCRGMENQFTNIYVTSSAGMGKTSFCKHICMTWCQAHNPVKTMNNTFKPEDIRAMLGFKCLFYIILRDVHRSLCKLDEIIAAFVEENLSVRSDKQLYQILNEKPCLVVVDGLDEWIHPDTCDRHRNEHDIPHRKYRRNWTILTTTQSWKLDIICLPANHIDSLIELNELDERSSYKLVQNAISVLNKKFRARKTVEEFYRTTSQIKLGDIRKIPYIHLHCVYLWYDGRNIGNSKCEIYSNILELTLNRGTQKMQFHFIPAPTQQERSAIIPKCMKDNEYCVHHRDLLLTIGKLAFCALFGSENRQMLVMDNNFARKYLGPDELNTCLKLGLLSQNKVYGLVSRRISNISFQHKTIQEYLAAFYMQSAILDPWSVSQNMHQLNQTCYTLSHILEMSEVFIFLSGFSSAAYRDILWQLIHSLGIDKNTQRYRSNFDLNLPNEDCNIVFKYQALLVDCVEEMQLNRQDFQPLPLEDVIINEQSKQAHYMSYIQKLIQGNSGGIKSLHVRECNSEEVTDILNRLDLQYFQSLEKLDLRAVARQPDIERLLQQSVNTLKCLAINYVDYNQGRYYDSMTVFSQVISDTVLSMSLLRSFSHINLLVTHNQLENVTTFLTSRVTMIQINMANITCSDHGKSCPGVQFHLSGHDNLQMLGLANVPVSQLQVNTQHLEECYIGRLPSSVITSCLTSLPAAHNLHRLDCSYLIDIYTLITILPLLTQLGELHITHTDLTDNRLFMTTDMTRLNFISLVKVSMRSSDLRALTDTISSLSQSVAVQLYNCTVTPETEYLTVKEDIRKSNSFTVTFDGINRASRNVFQFQTVK